MKHMPDLVLEGAKASEVDALFAVAAGQSDIAADVADRLRAKGWLDPCGAALLITVPGRVLIDRRPRS